MSASICVVFLHINGNDADMQPICTFSSLFFIRYFGRLSVVLRISYGLFFVIHLLLHSFILFSVVAFFLLLSPHFNVAVTLLFANEILDIKFSITFIYFNNL